MLVGCAAPVVDDPVACAGERAKFCGPEGVELSPPPPAPEGMQERSQSDATATRRASQPAPATPLLRPAPLDVTTLDALPK